MPWEHLCVDLIGPYTIERKNQPDPYLQAVTMIDPATGWLEIAQYDNKRPITVANIVEQTWLTRYPRPDICIIDRGSEFIRRQFKNELRTPLYKELTKIGKTGNHKFARASQSKLRFTQSTLLILFEARHANAELQRMRASKDMGITVIDILSYCFRHCQDQNYFFIT